MPGSLPATIGDWGHRVLDFIVGPILALLPTPWRRAVFFSTHVDWRRAGPLSGVAEFLGSIIVLGYWYMYAMTRWVDHAMSSALQGKIHGATVQGIGAVALTVWMTHPLTLFLGYCILEGAVRFLASTFMDETPGILPLALLDGITFGLFRRKPVDSGDSASFLRFVKDGWATLRASKLPDEIRFGRDESGETLVISASRRKEDWNPPRVVRYEDGYYRLERSIVIRGHRPFRYCLRRLPVGVPGRTVLIYSPVDPLCHGR